MILFAVTTESEAIERLKERYATFTGSYVKQDVSILIGGKGYTGTCYFITQLYGIYVFFVYDSKGVICTVTITNGNFSGINRFYIP